MLAEKRKDRPKYIAAKKQMRGVIYKLKSWGCKDLNDILDSSYKIASFFHTYYSCFQKKSDQALVQLQQVRHNPTLKAIQYYVLWRIIASISISNMLEIYKILNVGLKLEDIRGESFYAGIPSITQEEVDFALKIRSLYSELQGGVSKEVHNVFKETYGDFEGEYSEEGYDSPMDIPDIFIPSITGKMIKFCPCILLEDGKYHIWNR